MSKLCFLKKGDGRDENVLIHPDYLTEGGTEAQGRHTIATHSKRHLILNLLPPGLGSFLVRSGSAMRPLKDCFWPGERVLGIEKEIGAEAMSAGVQPKGKDSLFSLTSFDRPRFQTDGKLPFSLHYIYIYIYIYTHTHTHIHIHTYTHTHKTVGFSFCTSHVVTSKLTTRITRIRTDRAWGWSQS